jgi:hypothetical protein
VRRVILTAMVVFIALDLVVLLVAPKARTFSASASVAASPVVPSAAPPPSRCPNIDEAIDTLESAQSDLHEANHDLCGHKQAAIEATDHAVSELRAAQGCAKCTE